MEIHTRNLDEKNPQRVKILSNVMTSKKKSTVGLWERNP